MSKKSKRPNRLNRPPRSARSFPPKSRSTIERHPSAIESELICRWQDFAQERGYWVTGHVRVPEVSRLNEELPNTLGFVIRMPQNKAEADMFSEFARTEEHLIVIQGATFLCKPQFIYQPSTANELEIWVGWIVKDSSGNCLTPNDLDEYRALVGGDFR